MSVATQKTSTPRSLSELLKRSVEITVFREGKILAVNSRNFDGFCGVGGKTEPGESFEQAARRELLEETGCEARSITFVAGHTLDPIKRDDQTHDWYCAGFVVDIGDQEPRVTEEGTTPFWTTKEDMIANKPFSRMVCVVVWTVGAPE